jgi:hypothetical protein
LYPVFEGRELAADWRYTTKHLVFATSQDVRQDVTTTVIKLVPEPKKRTTRDQPSSTPPR